MSTQAWRPAGSEPTPVTVSCDLEVTPAREVRRLVRELLADRDGVLVEDALLVADELVSNALCHGRAPRACRITWVDRPGRLRIEVDDACAQSPTMRTPDRTGGRGLPLIDQLASAWGVYRYPDHKTVWAECAPDRTATASSHARHLAAVPLLRTGRISDPGQSADSGRTR